MLWEFLRGRKSPNRQNPKAATGRGVRQQTYPGRAAFALLGGGDTANQSMIGRVAESILQGRPGAEAPFLLRLLIDATQIPQRGQERKMSDALNVCAGFQPIIHEFD